MEHRWSSRADTSIKVNLYHNRNPAISCYAENIGLGGLFVRTGPMVYPKNTILEAQFQLADGLERYSIDVITWVVHKTGNGLGLMFVSTDAVLLKSINQILLDHAADRNPLQDVIPEPVTAAQRISVQQFR